MPAPDGTALFAQGKEGGLWRVPLDGSPAQRLETLGRAPYIGEGASTLALSSDGKSLGIGTVQDIGLRDLATGQTRWRRVLPAPGNIISAHPAGGGLLFVANDDSSMQWWNPATDAIVTLGSQAFFKWIPVSHDGDRAAWVDQSGTLHVADLAASQVRTLVGHHTAVRGLAMTPDGRWLASTQGDAVRVFSLPPAQERRINLRTPQAAFALGNRIRASAARGEVIAPLEGKTLVAIDARSGAQRKLLDRDSVQSVAISPDGRRAAVDGAGGGMVVVDLASGERQELAAVTDRCNLLTFVGNDSLLCDDREANFHAWDLPGGRHRILGRFPGHGHGGKLEVAHERKRATTALGVQVVVFDLGRDQVTRLGPTPSLAFRTAISRDGRKIAAGLADGRLLLWQPDDAGKEPRLLGRRQGFVSGLLFLPDGNTLVSTDETGTVYRIDLLTGQGAEIGRHEARTIDLVMSPSGRRLATADANGEIRLWEPATSGLSVLRGQGSPRSVEFIGEDWLLAAAHDGWIQLQPIKPEIFVPAAPAALSRWLDVLTTARVTPSGQPASEIRQN